MTAPTPPPPGRRPLPVARPRPAAAATRRRRRPRRAAPAEDTPVPGGTLRVGVEADTERLGARHHAVRLGLPDPGQARCSRPSRRSIPKASRHPYLAESIEPNDDYTVWTIKVRPGVTFHDGEKLDAAAMVKSLQRNAVTGFVGSAVANIEGAGPGKPAEGVGIKAIDDMTVEVTMTDALGRLPVLHGQPDRHDRLAGLVRQGVRQPGGARRGGRRLAGRARARSSSSRGSRATPSW